MSGMRDNEKVERERADFIQNGVVKESTETGWGGWVSGLEELFFRMIRNTTHTNNQGAGLGQA